VTVSVGWNGRTYKNNTINVNGIEFFNVEQTNATVSYLNRTKQVYCYSNKLFLEMGDSKDYTMLNYMIIKLNTTNIGFNYFSQQSSTVPVANVGKKLFVVESDSTNKGSYYGKNELINEWINKYKIHKTGNDSDSP